MVLALGTFPFGSNFSNIGGFTSGFLLGFVILTRRQHHWLNLNKSNTSQKQESYQYALRIISFVLLSVGLVGGGVLFFKGVDLNDYCSWCHYITCAPPSCKPGYISCEDYQIGNKLNVTCLNNGRSGIFLCQTVTLTSRLNHYVIAFAVNNQTQKYNIS
ncbi:hypothetical protein KIW84_043367 [Lathyrus oleraceus]|uniref:RHOMBOID-like protein n=1 Tax=Pisum sativum TaxID=3888 RepID=A0A9D5ATX3_PEA|nr:hypothetical protein KIW84_043367 [Pisum sativum]